LKKRKEMSAVKAGLDQEIKDAEEIPEIGIHAIGKEEEIPGREEGGILGKREGILEKREESLEVERGNITEEADREIGSQEKGTLRSSYPSR